MEQFPQDCATFVVVLADGEDIPNFAHARCASYGLLM